MKKLLSIIVVFILIFCSSYVSEISLNAEPESMENTICYIGTGDGIVYNGFKLQ